MSVRADLECAYKKRWTVNRQWHRKKHLGWAVQDELLTKIYTQTQNFMSQEIIDDFAVEWLSHENQFIEPNRPNKYAYKTPCS